MFTLTTAFCVGHASGWSIQEGPCIQSISFDNLSRDILLDRRSAGLLLDGTLLKSEASSHTRYSVFDIDNITAIISYPLKSWCDSGFGG